MGRKSDFGSLADRTAGGVRPAAPQARLLPAGQFVEVREDAGWSPGLLAAWERCADGTWWGRVVVVHDGQAEEILRIATALRPVAAAGGGSG